MDQLNMQTCNFIKIVVYKIYVVQDSSCMKLMNMIIWEFIG